jgi:hypothetical protein
MSSKRRSSENHTLSITKRIKLSRIPQSEWLVVVIDVTSTKRKHCTIDIAIEELKPHRKYVKMSHHHGWEQVVALMRFHFTKRISAQSSNPTRELHPIEWLQLASLPLRSYPIFIENGALAVGMLQVNKPEKEKLSLLQIEF